MLRVGIETNRGPLAIIGINKDNKLRLEAGMPMVVNIAEITPPGKRFREVVIHYAETYSDVVEDMAQGGLPVTDELRDMAKRLDEQLIREETSGPGWPE